MNDTTRNIFKGDVDVCCHLVEFWYDLGDIEITDELEESLTNEAESRAKHCITDGCRSGELNYADADDEIRGWFSVSV